MKIPDDVYLTRCQYCHHGRSGVENVEIPDDKLFIHVWTKDAPCGIIGISQCDRVPGECLSFTPNPMFGICRYCAFDNCFHDGYCTCPGGPVNKHRVFLGWGGGGYKNDYWGEHALFTCDRYQVSESWKDFIKRDVLSGRAPANFDPDTWEPLEKMEGTAASQEWAKLQAAERARAAAELESKEKQRETKAPSPDGQEQLSLFGEEGG